jgi:hypothetical protein
VAVPLTGAPDADGRVVRRARRALRRAWLVLLLVAGAVGAGDDTAFAPDEVKAAFLYGFTKYIEWPASRFPAPASPIGIGLYCADAPRGAREQVARGRQVNGRPVEVRTLERPGQARAVHLVFVCASSDAKVEAILREVEGEAVVVVGESDRSWLEGGMVQLVQVEDRMRFRLDVPAAERAGVKMGAQLQKLALTVRRDGASP